MKPCIPYKMLVTVYTYPTTLRTILSLLAVIFFRQNISSVQLFAAQLLRNENFLYLLQLADLFVMNELNYEVM